MAEPVLAGAVAWVVLGEALSAVQLAGAAVVLTGILLAETARQVHPAVEPVPEGVVP
jgi:drug/metabolite transporter (DMT)-like permease